MSEDEAPQPSRAVVAVDVAAAQSAQTRVANHDAAGDRAGPAGMRVLVHGPDTVPDPPAEEAEGALVERPAEVGTAVLVEALHVHLLAAILADVADQEPPLVDREPERVAEPAGEDLVAAALA